MLNDLLCCPFCGSRDVEVIAEEKRGGMDTIDLNHVFMTDGEDVIAYGFCNNCSTFGPTYNKYDVTNTAELEQAINKASILWNKRAT